MEAKKQFICYWRLIVKTSCLILVEYFFSFFFSFSSFIQQAWSVTRKRWNVIFDVKKLFWRKQHMISKDRVNYQELQDNTQIFQK